VNAVNSISLESLHPNPWNPNVMTGAEFAELVVEVKHLGRLPKPIVVRPNAEGFEIVDGEHGWRAAKECGLAEISVEIIDADDFEAMRQTYKRNQHGKHDKVKEGRMFRAILEMRQVSRRALAKELELSEGTIRNALIYAEADRLRNDYAFETLNVQQIRGYLDLPAPIRDYWLDAGANLALIQKATKNISSWDIHGKSVKTDIDGNRHEGGSWWDALVEKRFDVAIKPKDGYVLTADGFVENTRNAFALLFWQQHYDRRIEGAEDFARAAAQVHAAVGVLYLLPVSTETIPARALISAEDWHVILQRVQERAPKDDEQWRRLVTASLSLKLRAVGLDHDYTNPVILDAIEQLKTAPDFIRDADLSLEDRVYLADVTADALEDVLLDAKREAVNMLLGRDGWLGMTQETGDLVGISLADKQAVLSGWMGKVTAESAFKQALEVTMRNHEIEQRDALFADRAALLDRAVTVAMRRHDISETLIKGRPAHELLRERLAALPDPEGALLCALLAGEDDAALGVWLTAFRDGTETKP